MHTFRITSHTHSFRTQLDISLIFPKRHLCTLISNNYPPAMFIYFCNSELCRDEPRRHTIEPDDRQGVPAGFMNSKTCSEAVRFQT